MQKLLIEKICCPRCKGSLSYGRDAFGCSECNQTYPLVKGRPILVPRDAQSNVDRDALVASADNLQPRETVPQWDRIGKLEMEDYYFGRLFPSLNRRDPHWDFLGRKVTEMVAGIPEGSDVLDIGAGECKYGALLQNCHYVSTDFVFSSNKHDFSHIDVVSDASAIPFRDSSFDVALNLVVMEHVPDPNLAISEMARILKPGGEAYALIPLVRPEHLGPFDFYRFTRYAIRRLYEKNGLRIEQIDGSNNSLWTAVNYLSLYTKTRPLLKYGRRSLLGIVLNRFWSTLLWPLIEYARRTDTSFGTDFPIYYWVRAKKGSS